MPTEEVVKTDETVKAVAEKINEADSILVTLSKDPTVDEVTAALGLTLMLDKYGKHVTAIYSGKTPNALQFLRPDETFEANTNSLQDFIIALSKDKADHLRYKIEGDFVKVYITPYRTTISESDLEFSRGEVNVDLVIALDVVETEDLDAALAQHGRIMHNASLVNISNTAPGRLGGLEWSNPQASSVSEMIVTLLEQIGQPITKEVATALLTGIIAATERFSNERTTPDTMALASKLMQLGADQQLIVAQMADAMKEEQQAPEEQKAEEQVVPMENSVVSEAPEAGSDMLDIKHEEELTPEQQLERMINGSASAEPNNTGSIMDELKNINNEEREEPVEQNLSTPEVSEFAPTATPVVPEDNTKEVAAIPQSKVVADTIYGTDVDRTLMQDKTMVPLEERPKDYGALMDEALAEQPTNPAMMAAPVAPAGPEVPAMAETPIAPVTTDANIAPVEPVMPAMPAMPEVQPQPVMQPVAQPEPVMQPQPVAQPEPAPQPMMGGIELPPPPTPDTSATMPPAAPVVPEMPVIDNSAAQLATPTPTGMQVQTEPINPVVVQPEQNPVEVPPVQDPGAFKIPGM